ncbi:uncharacterized protein AB675_8468 [Cyphellophora attinorum]|uniref:Uncharacterized protein n=1 Tax=Cyphellophora attinorum TaxID=1664694 RepID=A0A0N1HZQ0_9EURO|nr:uncharacterized protein AB675_8468 [Phialophora attinorum]KPI44374.1 hypothetical protein AB675_8468 [Phialophora attinorum]
MPVRLELDEVAPGLLGPILLDPVAKETIPDRVELPLLLVRLELAEIAPELLLDEPEAEVLVRITLPGSVVGLATPLAGTDGLVLVEAPPPTLEEEVESSAVVDAEIVGAGVADIALEPPPSLLSKFALETRVSDAPLDVPEEDLLMLLTLPGSTVERATSPMASEEMLPAVLPATLEEELETIAIVDADVVAAGVADTESEPPPGLLCTFESDIDAFNALLDEAEAGLPAPPALSRLNVGLATSLTASDERALAVTPPPTPKKELEAIKAVGVAALEVDVADINSGPSPPLIRAIELNVSIPGAVLDESGVSRRRLLTLLGPTTDPKPSLVLLDDPMSTKMPLLAGEVKVDSMVAVVIETLEGSMAVVDAKPSSVLVE